jgi:hypothetical protein
MKSEELYDPDLGVVKAYISDSCNTIYNETKPKFAIEWNLHCD